MVDILLLVVFRQTVGLRSLLPIDSRCEEGKKLSRQEATLLNGAINVRPAQEFLGVQNQMEGVSTSENGRFSRNQAILGKIWKVRGLYST